MKKVFITAAAVLVSLTITGVSLAADQAPAKKEPAKKPSIRKEQTISETATVEAVDLTTRVLTLKGSKGNVFDLKAGEEVRNLPQVKVGDQVKVKFYQSLAVDVMAAGKAPGGVQEAVVMDRAKLGDKPGGMIGSQVTMTATVEAIDKKNQTVTLKGPEGRTKVVKVQNPKNLKNVKVGDEVVITLTEAVAISVEEMKK
jgi:ribosomal 50S subunit-recycling heat shock protein